MLFDFTRADPGLGDALVRTDVAERWGADSEYGRLRDVMLSAPSYLEVLPCNAVATEALASGLVCCPVTAETQHSALVEALEAEGVRCHLVPARQGLPDLTFTRDTTLMTPWGLVQLAPGVAHRREEADHARRAAALWGVPFLGAIEQGRVEGGDVCLLRPGVVVIGCSGERTDEAGARALASIFEARGWRTIVYRFDPHFLHLDTQFTMLDRNRALACVECLEESFLLEMQALGIDLVPVTYAEVQRLGGNVLSLGDRRIVSPADNRRLNGELERLGYRVIPVEIDQFVRCGGGVHCLTLPLARASG